MIFDIHGMDTLWIDCRVQTVAVSLADVNKHWTSVFTDLVLIAGLKCETFFTFSLSTGCVNAILCMILWL